MNLSALAGNPRLKEMLSQREEGRGLSHAYIISGPVGSGRHTLARTLSAAMMCTAALGERPCGKCPSCKKVFAAIHPDVVVTAGGGEGKPIAVDQVRAIRSDAHIRPNEGERKVYVLEGAEQMNPSAQNAMLKLLEEGPNYAAFLLLCNSTGTLLQTVRSRCEELLLTPVSLKECRSWLRARFPEKSEAELEQATLDCQGILGRAVEQLEGTDEGVQVRNRQVRKLADALETGSELEVFEAAMALEKQSREDLTKGLDALEGELGVRMARSSDRRRLFRGVELVRRLRAAARLNANPGQISGWLCAGMF
ncbi:MAG: AAA family ATPase [Lawsonibacter sp.]